MPKDEPEVLGYATPRRRRRVNWHSVVMFVAIALVAVTFIAAVWAASRTFQVR